MQSLCLMTGIGLDDVYEGLCASKPMICHYEDGGRLARIFKHCQEDIVQHYWSNLSIALWQIDLQDDMRVIHK